MDADRTLAEHLAEAARSLAAEPDPQSTMDLAVELAVKTVQGCDAAGISLVQRGGKVTTAAWTADTVLACDLLQYELGEGPCLDATWDEPVVHSRDLAHETRWPAWSSRVAQEHSARSMLCLRLFTDSRTLGALNLYAVLPEAFDTRDRDEGLALAALVATTVADAQENAALLRALDTRTVIGQACGILMERFSLGDNAAFQVLARVSSQTNVRVSDVARELVETRQLAGLTDQGRDDTPSDER